MLLPGAGSSTVRTQSGVPRGAFLAKKPLAVGAVREPLERHRPAGDVRQQHRRHPRVVVDDLALGEPVREQDLVQVGQRQPPPVHLDRRPSPPPAIPSSSASRDRRCQGRPRPRVAVVGAAVAGPRPRVLRSGPFGRCPSRGSVCLTSAGRVTRRRRRRGAGGRACGLLGPSVRPVGDDEPVGPLAADGFLEAQLRMCTRQVLMHELHLGAPVQDVGLVAGCGRLGGLRVDEP